MGRVRDGDILYWAGSDMGIYYIGQGQRWGYIILGRVFIQKQLTVAIVGVLRVVIPGNILCVLSRNLVQM